MAATFASTGPRTRMGGSTRQVDESLFGSAKGASLAKGGTRRSSDVAIVSASQLKSVLAPAAHAAVVRETDLERIRASAQIKTWDDEKRELRSAAEALAAKKAKANARKAYMLQKEEERKKNVPLTDLERADLEKREVVLSNAALKLAEGLDDVKQVRAARRAPRPRRAVRRAAEPLRRVRPAACARAPPPRR